MTPVSESDTARLKARELHLLQKRTEILKQQQKLVDGPAWNPEAADELSREHDRIEAELATVRRKLMDAGV